MAWVDNLVMNIMVFVLCCMKSRLSIHLKPIIFWSYVRETLTERVCKINRRKYGNINVADCNPLNNKMSQDVTIFVNVTVEMGEPRTCVVLLGFLGVCLIFMSLIVTFLILFCTYDVVLQMDHITVKVNQRMLVLLL